MKRRPATCLRARSIQILIVLALAGACSNPNRETPTTAPNADAGDVQPSSAQPQPAPLPRDQKADVQERRPTPAETPITPPAPAETRSAKASAPPPETAPDPLKEMESAEARRVAYEQNLMRLAAERDAAAEAVTRCEKDLLAFKNPFRPRPQLAPNEAEEIKGMDGVARTQWAEGRLKDAKAALEAAQKAYDDAKANPPSS